MNPLASNEAGVSVVWHSRPGALLMFYPDITHAVLPVSDGLRATLAFKVFALSEVAAPALATQGEENSALAETPVTNEATPALLSTREQLLRERMLVTLS